MFRDASLSLEEQFCHTTFFGGPVPPNSLSVLIYIFFITHNTHSLWENGECVIAANIGEAIKTEKTADLQKRA